VCEHGMDGQFKRSKSSVIYDIDSVVVLTVHRVNVAYISNIHCS